MPNSALILAEGLYPIYFNYPKNIIKLIIPGHKLI